MTVVNRILGEAGDFVPPSPESRLLILIKKLYLDLDKLSRMSDVAALESAVGKDFLAIWCSLNSCTLPAKWLDPQIWNTWSALEDDFNQYCEWLTLDPNTGEPLSSPKEIPDGYEESMLKRILDVLKRLDKDAYTTFCLDHGIEIDWL